MKIYGVYPKYSRNKITLIIYYATQTREKYELYKKNVVIIDITGKKKQTRKNRFNISTPFDAVAEIRAQETHNKHMEQMKISTNPFGRTANKKYGIDTASITGKEILKIADRLQRKRDRRRRSGKPELMHEERELKKQQKANFLKEIEKLRPPHWE